MLKVTVLAAVAVLVVLAAAGCGSKKSSSGAPTTTTAAATSETTTEATTTEATTTSSSGGTPSFASTKNCKELQGLAAKVSQSFQPNANGEVDLSKEADALDALASAAPNEIKGDFKTFAEAFKNFAKLYGDIKLKPGATPTAGQIAKLTKAAQSFNTPKLQQATQRLSAWGSTHCGISSTG